MNKPVCQNCHHWPSMRFRENGYECYCKCHDVADAAPALVNILERLTAAYIGLAKAHGNVDCENWTEIAAAKEAIANARRMQP